MKNIVIVGAGFAGIRVALGLAEKIKSTSQYNIILIDKKSRHTYIPSLYEVATAYRGSKIVSDAAEKKFKEELINSSSFVIREVIRGLQIMFIQEEITDVSLKEKFVQTRSGEIIDFEYAVIAIGAVPTFFNVEGARGNSYSLTSIPDALLIRDEVERLFKDFSSRGKHDMHFAMVGAGMTGFEVATELATYIRHLSRAYNVSLSKVKISLIEARSEILASVSGSMRKRARSRLKSLNINVLTNARIVKILHKKIIFANNKELDADFIFWGGGIKGPEFLKKIENLKLEDSSGKIIVDKYLRVSDYPYVFSIGDVSYIYDEKRKLVVPSTVWAAQQQADALIYNISASINARALKEYHTRFPGFVSSAGGKHAVAHLYGVTFSGFGAWALKRVIDLKYITSIFPLFRGIRIWLRALRLFAKND